MRASIDSSCALLTPPYKSSRDQGVTFQCSNVVSIISHKTEQYFWPITAKRVLNSVGRVLDIWSISVNACWLIQCISTLFICTGMYCLFHCLITIICKTQNGKDFSTPSVFLCKESLAYLQFCRYCTLMLASQCDTEAVDTTKRVDGPYEMFWVWKN